jgi:hypothetical protein
VEDPAGEGRGEGERERREWDERFAEHCQHACVGQEKSARTIEIHLKAIPVISDLVVYDMDIGVLIHVPLGCLVVIVGREKRGDAADHDVRMHSKKRDVKGHDAQYTPRSERAGVGWVSGGVRGQQASHGMGHEDYRARRLGGEPSLIISLIEGGEDKTSTHHARKFLVAKAMGFRLLYVGYRLVCILIFRCGGILADRYCCRSVGNV